MLRSEQAGQGGGPQSTDLSAAAVAICRPRAQKRFLNGVGMTLFQVGQLAARCGLPEAQCFIGADAGQELTARRKRQIAVTASA